MAIRIMQTKGGYSDTTANKYVKVNKPIHSVSTELEIIAYKATFVQEGLEPFQIKFKDKIKLPEFLSLVEFDNLQAVEVRYNVYFKADGIKEVK